MKFNKSTITQIIVLTILALLYWFTNKPIVSLPVNSLPTKSSENQLELLQEYYQNKVSKKMIKLSGVNVKNLADDLKAPRHQKFIMELSNDFTVLVTHNIDLAPRINSLSEGDLVEVYGQYEWNAKGGILHWTHHDPKGRRQGGWIIHNGEKYE